MAGRKSEENYKLAKSLYYDISDSFYDIENEEVEDKDFLIDVTLEDIKKLNRYIARINIEELEEYVDVRSMDIIENNIDTFKEAAYFIEKTLIGIRAYDKLLVPLYKYMENADWAYLDNNIEDAAKKVATYLTLRDNNVEIYKNQINAISRRSFPKNSFVKLFNDIKASIKTTKKEKSDKVHPNPPEMYSPEKRKEWEEHLKKRRESGVEDEKVEWDITDESFTSFKKYKKIFE
jgi:uncharacterized protein (UPF0128 family)